MSTVAEIIEAVKEWPETEKGVLFRELDPLREPAASRGSLARKSCAEKRAVGFARPRGGCHGGRMGNDA